MTEMATVRLIDGGHCRSAGLAIEPAPAVKLFREGDGWCRCWVLFRERRLGALSGWQRLDPETSVLGKRHRRCRECRCAPRYLALATMRGDGTLPIVARYLDPRAVEDKRRLADR